MSNVELADRVGLTPPPWLRRVKRLEAEAAIVSFDEVVAVRRLFG